MPFVIKNNMDNKTNEEISQILKITPEETKAAIEDARAARELARNDFNANSSKTVRQALKLPPKLEWFITWKYGKDIWQNKKFMKELWDTLKVFRACEKF